MTDPTRRQILQMAEEAGVTDPAAAERLVRLALAAFRPAPTTARHVMEAATLAMHSALCRLEELRDDRAGDGNPDGLIGQACELDRLRAVVTLLSQHYPVDRPDEFVIQA